jgi:hypothetical protein
MFIIHIHVHVHVSCSRSCSYSSSCSRSCSDSSSCSLVSLFLGLFSFVFPLSLCSTSLPPSLPFISPLCLSPLYPFLSFSIICILSFLFFLSLCFSSYISTTFSPLSLPSLSSISPLPLCLYLFSSISPLCMSPSLSLSIFRVPSPPSLPFCLCFFPLLRLFHSVSVSFLSSVSSILSLFLSSVSFPMSVLLSLSYTVLPPLPSFCQSVSSLSIPLYPPQIGIPSLSLSFRLSPISLPLSVSPQPFLCSSSASLPPSFPSFFPSVSSLLIPSLSLLYYMEKSVYRNNHDILEYCDDR